MGRPIPKKNFGLLDDGTNITVNCKVGSNGVSAQGYILRQKGTKKFLVNDTKNGTKTATNGSGTGNVSICTLVDKAPGSLAADEMSIQGYIVGDGDQVRIKKLYRKCCYDFNGVRYKWSVSNDSTVSILALTAV